MPVRVVPGAGVGVDASRAVRLPCLPWAPGPWSARLWSVADRTHAVTGWPPV